MRWCFRNRITTRLRLPSAHCSCPSGVNLVFASEQASQLTRVCENETGCTWAPILKFRNLIVLSFQAWRRLKLRGIIHWFGFSLLTKSLICEDEFYDFSNYDRINFSTPTLNVDGTKYTVLINAQKITRPGSLVQGFSCYISLEVRVLTFKWKKHIGKLRWLWLKLKFEELFKIASFYAMHTIDLEFGIASFSRWNFPEQETSGYPPFADSRNVKL